MTGAPSRRGALRYFDERAAGYRAAAERGLWGWQRRREAKAVDALIGVPVAGRSVLDLGCGTGFYARRLADSGAAPVVAVDASERMVAQIADPRIEGVVGDVATVDLGRRFDIVLSAGVLEFVEDAPAVLRNARRHLAADGTIVALVPPAGLAGQLYRLFHRSHGVTVGLFSRRRLEAAATAAGLSIAASRFVYPFTMVHAMVAP